MTSVTTGPVLTEEDRITALEHLDARWDEQPPGVREYLLAVWAHPGLTPQRRDEICALYADSRERMAALDANGWETEVPGLTCDDRQSGAREHLGNLAREALFVLKHGEGEES